jgi:hypothetical protein
MCKCKGEYPKIAFRVLRYDLQDAYYVTPKLEEDFFTSPNPVSARSVEDRCLSC